MHGRVVSIMAFELDGDRIVELDVLADPMRLESSSGSAWASVGSSSRPAMAFQQPCRPRPQASSGSMSVASVGSTAWELFTRRSTS